MTKRLDIKTLRQRLNLSRAELASQAKVDVSTICRWENEGVPKRGAARAFLENLAENPPATATTEAA